MGKAPREPDVPDREHVAHLVFIFEDGGRIEPHEYRIGFCPSRSANCASGSRPQACGKSTLTSTPPPIATP